MAALFADLPEALENSVRSRAALAEHHLAGTICRSSPTPDGVTIDDFIVQ